MYTRTDLSYAAALAPQQQQLQTANPPTSPMHTKYQHTHPQLNDIQELKTMMKQLVEQMSTTLHLLTTVVTKLS
jgi:2-keto-4-pentenoate hydratase/2-oxohepta-3-ene-1,7-dioic acid hydratase in catechol pathway